MTSVEIVVHTKRKLNPDAGITGDSWQDFRQELKYAAEAAANFDFGSIPVILQKTDLRKSVALEIVVEVTHAGSPASEIDKKHVNNMLRALKEKIRHSPNLRHGITVSVVLRETQVSTQLVFVEL